MRQSLLCTSMLVGLGAAAFALPAHASDGIKLDVGGFFSSAYVATFDSKKSEHPGEGRNLDALKHDAEVNFRGETTLDNGLTIEARIELEGEEDAGNGPDVDGDGTGDGDQIDKSWVSWSGGFGMFRIGAQDDALETFCASAPGGTNNFSAFSPTGWGANAPISSNSYCFSADNDSQKVLYVTPNFGGFQLSVSYTPSANAETYGQAGVNGAGTPTHPDGTAHHVVSAYATYGYEGEDWSFNWGGGGSWQLKFNETTGDGANDGKSQAYQTGAAVYFGGFGVGGVFQYFEQGGEENNLWVAGAGASYTFDAWTLGLQYSHGRYDGNIFGDGLGDGGLGVDGHHRMDRVVLTALWHLAPGVDLDADLGYTWYKDTRDLVPDARDSYSAFEIGIGSSLAF